MKRIHIKFALVLGHIIPLCLSVSLLIVLCACHQNVGASILPATSGDSVSAVTSAPSAAAARASGNVSSSATNQPMEGQYMLNNLILLKTTEDTYTINSNGNIDFSYDLGKNNSSVSTEPDTDNGPVIRSVFVSPQKTAVAYVPLDNSSVQIKYSDDQGVTWETSQPILPSPSYYQNNNYTQQSNAFLDISSCCITFPTSSRGYLLIGSGTTMGIQYLRAMFQTTDGGKTWAYLKSNLENPDNPAGSIDQMTFTNQDVGYICADQPNSDESYLLRTADGGVTWTACALTIPTQYKEADNAQYLDTTALTPYESKENWYLPVIVNANPKSVSKVIYYTSNDGVTWIYDSSLDALLSAYVTQQSKLPG